MKPLTALMGLCLAAVLLGCAPAHSGEMADLPTVTTVIQRVLPTMTLMPTAMPSPTATERAMATSSPIPSPLPTPTAIPERPLVAIDPGHGGRDLGARHFDAEGHMDYAESEVNLDLALRLRELLFARGFRVLMTRDDDYLLNEDREDVNGNGEVDHVDEAQARVDLINASDAELLLSIHQNAFYGEDGEPATDVGGTVTFYCAERPFSDENLRFAQLLQSSMVEAFHDLGHDVRDRGVEVDLVLQMPDEPGSHLILLGPEAERIVRPCQVPGALSETLFITHAREAELARDPVVLDRLALAYADAISAFFDR